MKTQTPTQQIASILLGQDVHDWIRNQRAAGHPWRIVARNLYEATNQQVDVTYESLRSWAGEDITS